MTVDTLAYKTLTTIGQLLNTSGAILFLVNPAGTRIDESDSNSGEQSLRFLAAESGGRYFEGTQKDIANDVNSMEGGLLRNLLPRQAGIRRPGARFRDPVDTNRNSRSSRSRRSAGKKATGR